MILTPVCTRDDCVRYSEVVVVETSLLSQEKKASESYAHSISSLKQRAYWKYGQKLGEIGPSSSIQSDVPTIVRNLKNIRNDPRTNHNDP